MGGVASAGTQTAFGYDFQRVIGRVRLRLPHRIQVSIAGMLGRDGNSFSSSQPGSDPLQIALQNSRAGLRVDAEIPWADWTRTQLGLDIDATNFQVDASIFVPPGLGEYEQPLFSPTGNIPIQRAVPRALGAVYVDQIFTFGPLELSAALRLDYNRYGDVSQVYPDPRAVTRWQVVPELVLKAATGLFSQQPVAFQLTREGGNPALQPTRAWQSSGGFELTLPERIEVHSTFFYSAMFNLTEQRTRVVPSPEGPRRVFFTDDGEGRAYGLELLVRRRIERGLYGWLSYTLSRSERLTSSGRWQSFVFDQTHTLNLALSYSIDGWRFGVAFQLSTGRPNDTLVSTRFDSEGAEYDPGFRREGERLPTFHRLDIRIDRDFDIGPIRGSVYLDIQNVYNSPNNEGVIYNYDFSQTAALPGLPILPTLGIRGWLQ